MVPHPKLFKRVFEATQKTLRDMFGLELVELHTWAWNRRRRGLSERVKQEVRYRTFLSICKFADRDGVGMK